MDESKRAKTMNDTEAEVSFQSEVLLSVCL